MGIDERRGREREQRRQEILQAAWRVASVTGWAAFSVERVATDAELGRATVYGYFESLEALVLEMARGAVDELSARMAAAVGLTEALDVPVRFAQANAAGFALIFPPSHDPRSAFSNDSIEAVRSEAQQLVGRLQRLAERSGATLPEDARSAASFIAGISMAAAVVPELRASTTLRHRFQEFCLGERPRKGEPQPDDDTIEDDADPSR